MKQTQLALKRAAPLQRKHNSERMWRIREPRLAPAALQQSLKQSCAGHLMLAIMPTHYDVICFRTDFLSAQTKPWHPLRSTGQSNSSKVSRGHFIIPRRIDSSWGWLTRRKREKGHGIYNLEYIMHTRVLGSHHCRHIWMKLKAKTFESSSRFLDKAQPARAELFHPARLAERRARPQRCRLHSASFYLTFFEAWLENNAPCEWHTKCGLCLLHANIMRPQPAFIRSCN